MSAMVSIQYSLSGAMNVSMVQLCQPRMNRNSSLKKVWYRAR